MAGQQNRRAIVITGASTGIGRATAMHLDDLGFRVFAGVRKQADADSLTQERSTIEPLLIDVTDRASIDAAARQVEEAVGDAGLAGLVNNAGIGVGGPLEIVDIDDLRRQLEVNVIGQVAVTQAFLPLLRTGKGRVALVSSIGGRIASPFMAPYSASKFALEAIGDSLRLELRHFGIEVALIEPGSIATPIWEKADRSEAELMGSSPDKLKLYEAQIAAFSKARERVAGDGIPPIEVAEKIAHALTAAKPRTRYVVGRDAKRNGRVAAIVSDRMLDRLKAKRIGLP